MIQKSKIVGEGFTWIFARKEELLGSSDLERETQKRVN